MSGDLLDEAKSVFADYCDIYAIEVVYGWLVECMGGEGSLTQGFDFDRIQRKLDRDPVLYGRPLYYGERGSQLCGKIAELWESYARSPDYFANPDRLKWAVGRLVGLLFRDGHPAAGQLLEDWIALVASHFGDPIDDLEALFTKYDSIGVIEVIRVWLAKKRNTSFRNPMNFGTFHRVLSCGQHEDEFNESPCSTEKGAELKGHLAYLYARYCLDFVVNDPYMWAVGSLLRLLILKGETTRSGSILLEWMEDVDLHFTGANLEARTPSPAPPDVVKPSSKSSPPPALASSTPQSNLGKRDRSSEPQPETESKKGRPRGRPRKAPKV